MPKKLFLLQRAAIIAVLTVFFMCISALAWAQEDGRATTEEPGSRGGTPSGPAGGNSANGVGAMDADLLDADQGGSFNYTYPIDLPPGTNGVGPSLAIAYSSSGENGMLGVGFSLRGLSEITRDRSYPVNFDGNDHYLLDGQKLIWVPEGTKDVVNAGYFHTERESFVRVAACDANGNKINPQNASICYWVVSQKNGTRMYYGYTSTDHDSANDGRIEAIGKGLPRLWALSKVEDVNGNYYTVEYYEDTATGAYYPKKTVYTRGNGLTKFKEVDFYYEKRAEYDHCEKYIPTKVDEDLRLCWIAVKIDGKILREYKIEYEYSTSYKFLCRAKAIYEYGSGGDGPSYKSKIIDYSNMGGFWLFDSIEIVDNYNTSKKSLPPVKFYWEGYALIDFETPASYTSGPAGYNPNQLFKGDFDGDGRNDLYMVAGNGWYCVVRSTGEKFEGQLGAENITNYQENKCINTVGDFNGDGRTDFACFRPDYGSLCFLISTGGSDFRVIDDICCLNEYIDIGLEEFINYLVDYTGYNQIFVADFNGDGIDELVLIQKKFIFEAPQNGKIINYQIDTIAKIIKPVITDKTVICSKAYNIKFDSISISANSNPYIDILSIDFINSVSFGYTIGDFNGDGKSELACYRENGTIYILNFNNDPSGKIILQANKIQFMPCGYNKDKLFAGNFNGDDKDDLYMGSDTGYYAVLTSTGQNFFNTINIISIGTGYGCTVGDFNGDGLTDFGCYHSSGIYAMLISIGNEFIISKAGPGSTYPAGYRTDKIYAGDFNGDGMDDLAVVADNGWYSVQISDGKHFEWQCAENITDGKLNLYGCVVGDFNGDGLADFGCYKFDGNYCLIKSIIHHPQLLASVLNTATGKKIDVVYKPACAFPGAIAAGEDRGSIKANRNPRQLVESITYSSLYNGARHGLTYRYEYHNGKIYQSAKKHEQRLLGFEYVKKINPDGSFTVSYYMQDPKMEGLVSRIQNYGSDNALYSETDYFHYNKILQSESSESNSNSINYIMKEAEFTYNYNGTASMEPVTYASYFYYDKYGNITTCINYGEIPFVKFNSFKEYAAYRLNDPIVSDNTMVGYTFVYKDSPYMTPLVEELKSGHKLDFNANEYESAMSPASHTKYYYDYNTAHGAIGSRGLLTKAETRVDNAEWISTSNKYDACGNLVEATDAKGNASATAYDADYHAYVVGRNNADPNHRNKEGYTTSIVYGALMRPISTMDVNSQKWSFSYDEYGRVIKEWSPLDDESNPNKGMEYADARVDENGNITSYLCVKVYRKENANADYSSKSGYLEGYAYYDGLGRLIQSKTEGMENDVKKWRTVDYYYDGMGRNWKTSVAYFTNGKEYSSPDSSIKYARLEYDPIGRIKYAHNTDGNKKTNIYKHRWTVNIDENNHATLIKRAGAVTEAYAFEGSFDETGWDSPPAEYSKTQTKPAWNGVIITSWDDHNNPIRIKTENDMLGRKTWYSDPDKGTWGYEYDDNGNLSSQTDSEGQTVSFEYDSLNRVTRKKWDSEYKTRYIYDQAGYGCSLGRLARVFYEDRSYEEFYRYDEKGRVYNIGKIIDNNMKRLIFSYDSMDRVVTESYPDGDEVIKYAYSDDGNLEKVESNYSYCTYVKDINYEAGGKVTRMALGNGVVLNYGYDPDSFRLASIFTDDKSLFDLSYTYDAVGNVKTRTDNNYAHQAREGHTEEYGYDEFNRLVRADSAYQLYGTKRYSYDRTNNIRQKDGRTYEYGDSGTRPHAVTNDGKYAYEYDGNGNMTTRSENGVTNRTIAYDYENRVASISDGGTYSYGDGGRRIKKIENGITTYYYFDKYEIVDDGTAKKEIKYYFANGRKIAQRTRTIGTSASTSELIYFLADHLGSTTVLTNKDGNLIQKTGYMPYGELAYMTNGGGSNLDDSKTNYMFTGQEKEGNNLYYYGARYYDPALGRFLQADTVLDGLNRYAYCGNNPVNYVDPTGHGIDYANMGGSWSPDKEESTPDSSGRGGADVGCGAGGGPSGGVSSGVQQTPVLPKESTPDYAGSGGSVVPHKPAFHLPLDKASLNSVNGTYDYTNTEGVYKRLNHPGLDLGAENGTIGHPSMGGTVISNKWKDTSGHNLIIDHHNGYITVYKHLFKKPDFKEGDTITQQDTFEVGDTGTESTGPHLHFELRTKDEKEINSLSMINLSDYNIKINQKYIGVNGNGDFYNILEGPK